MQRAFEGDLMESSEMRVRRAGPEDVEAIAGLSATLFREAAGRREPGVNPDWPEARGRGYFAGLVAGDGSVCLLAEAGGEVVGYLAARAREGTNLRPAKTAELESMYVREEYRNSGVGARLAEEFFVWAKLRGAERASVTAYADNGGAIRFYERWGFRPRSVSLDKDIG
jgi:ribosomal protein S18 acetylase RimI-like enzyme